MTTKIRFMGNNGEMQEIEFQGLLEALEYVKDNGIRGAKFQMSGGDWDDVDRFMEVGRQMFAPLTPEEEEAQKREQEDSKDSVIHLTLVEPGN